MVLNIAKSAENQEETAENAEKSSSPSLSFQEAASYTLQVWDEDLSRETEVVR